MSDRATVHVSHPAGYATERVYAINVLIGTFLGLDVAASEARVDEWRIQCNGGEFSLPDVLFRIPGRDWLTPVSLPSDASLYGDDLFGSAFFMLTRYEEIALADRDVHARFPSEAAIAVRSGFLERPVVNEIAERLWQLLLRVAPRLARRQRPFRVLPSHDVDYATATLLQRAAILRAGNLGALFKDPFDTFDLLMSAAERLGLRTAFYFLARDAPYSLDDPKIRRLLRVIHARGHEIGFHASYSAFADAERTRAEFLRLVRICEQEGILQNVWGGRAHYLRWDPSTWRIWNAAGLAYDASVGFADRPGFRAGACYEYPVFDLSQRRELPLYERPLVLMDNPTLAASIARGDDPRELIYRLRRECSRFGGDFTTLWHNNWVIGGRRRKLLEVAFVGEEADARWLEADRVG